jgi:hypothetical protein
MSASDPLIDVCVAGLDLVPLQMAITLSGAAIGPPPMAVVVQSQSVILYCKRHSNIERLIERARSEFADVPTGVTLSELVSAALNCAALFGVSIMTETEVYDLATETVVQMEAELAEIQPVGGLSALNRSARSDAAVADAGVPGWQRIIFSCLAGGSKGRWHDGAVILHRFSAGVLTASIVIIDTLWADTVRQFDDCAFRLAAQGERLAIRLLRHLSIIMRHAAKRMAHRRRVYDR